MPPPTILTPALLHSLRSTPRLPQHTWYFVTSIVLSTLNRPDLIPKLFTWTCENGVGPNDTHPPSEEEKLKVVRRMREGLVKSTAVVGLPKTINALLALKKATPVHLLDSPNDSTSSGFEAGNASLPDILGRGRTLFDNIYTRISGRVMGQMLHSGSPDLGLTAQIAYGMILSAPPTLSSSSEAPIAEAIDKARGMGQMPELLRRGHTLQGPEISWVLIAGLVPQDVNPQLKGHLKGGVNLGATAGEVRAVRGLCVRICEVVGGMRVLRRVGDGELVEEDRGRCGWWEEVENIAEDWMPGAKGGREKEVKL